MPKDTFFFLLKYCKRDLHWSLEAEDFVTRHRTSNGEMLAISGYAFNKSF